ncbi:YgiT-type zinc finger protein [Tychonema sp. LEGE 06208]|uniref:YgiT-type zinc finger protein n=1 Tax=Microcoleaceae TaxID=1892252 RepID=UPI00351C6390
MRSIENPKSGIRRINSGEKSDAIPGSNSYEERKINYLYRHQGKYLLVPNTPVEICIDCGMIYYDAAVIKEI